MQLWLGSLFTIPFTLIHLADALIQNNLQMRNTREMETQNNVPEFALKSRNVRVCIYVLRFQGIVVSLGICSYKKYSKNE